MVLVVADGPAGVVVRIKRLHPDVRMPSYAHSGDAGLDVYSRELRTLEQGEPYLFRLGFATEIPAGFVGLVCDRSSLGLRGVRVLGGVIDSSFRGEWGVILVNLTRREVLVRPGDKIAQVLFFPVARAVLEEATDLGVSSRRDRGFGSSGR